MADINNETDELLDNAAADLVNASAKEQADEIRNEAQDSLSAENSVIQQNTAALIANTQAQNALNEAKQKTLLIDQAIQEANNLYQRKDTSFNHEVIVTRDGRGIVANTDTNKPVESKSELHTLSNTPGVSTVRNGFGNIIGELDNNQAVLLKNLYDSINNVSNIKTQLTALDAHISKLANSNNPADILASRQIQSVRNGLNESEILKEIDVLDNKIYTLLEKATENFENRIAKTAERIESAITMRMPEVATSGFDMSRANHIEENAKINNQIINAFAQSVVNGTFKRFALENNIVGRNRELGPYRSNIDSNYRTRSQEREAALLSQLPNLEKLFNQNFLLSSGNDIALRQTRGALSDFYSLGSSINKLGSGNLGATGFEIEIQEKYKKFEEIINGLLSEINNKKIV